MKILIVNEKLVEGGTEVYVQNLIDILTSDRNDVKLITFDYNYDANVSKIQNKKNIENTYNLKVKNNKLNKLIFNPFLYYKLRKYIKQFNPEHIILNNIFCSPITQIKALKGFDIIQIVHDYGIICPKSTCLKDNFKICTGYKENNCLKECKYHNSKMDVYFKLYLTKKMEGLRKKIVRKFITPSNCLKCYINKYNYNSICINNPLEITQNYIEASKKFEKQVITYIYVGGINENKGIFKFLDVFNEFSNKKNVELIIVGKPSTNEYKNKLDNFLNSNNKIKYVGFLPNSEVVEKIKNSHFIVVPSLWMENYPTTVLEGILCKTVVLGSNRGGIPEMLDNNKGIVFDIMNFSDIMTVLEQSYNINLNRYNEIVDTAYNYLIKNNSFETYKNKLINELIK